VSDMNAIMTFASAAGQLQRYDAIRRKNAEQAYHRQAEYNGRNQKMLDELEALLTGKNETDSRQVGHDIKKLDTEQVKQIALPLRKTVEEKIEPWRDGHLEVNSVQETETRLALQKREQSQIAAQALNSAPMDHPTNLEREMLLEQRRFAKAISAYSIQVEAKRNGFIAEWPNFNKSA
jgi:hypothetical protein